MRSPRGPAAIPAAAASAPPAATPPEALAARAADQAALSGADRLAKGAGEAFVRTGVTPGGGGLHFASYERTYHGLPVIAVGTQAALDAGQAAKNTTSEVSTVDTVAAPKLVLPAGDADHTAQFSLTAGTGTPPTGCGACGGLPWTSTAERHPGERERRRTSA
ncbi:hypothetical protein [Amycolatopsis sp. MtRt-6]|uniref:hypothetical protein n=1 Tax=Amycolatopsis sp. MtRt-6 TaxID=2792782 RepID=UPI001F5C476E|nr:hypothetical protein [Amycolatopsis sp. MtRt-6]